LSDVLERQKIKAVYNKHGRQIIIKAAGRAVPRPKPADQRLMPVPKLY